MTDPGAPTRDAIRADRLSALERMARGVAHDFNNDLAIISGVADLMVGDAKLPLTRAQARQYAQVLHRASVDASALVSRLQAFGRASDDHASLETVDIATIVSEAAAVCRAQLVEETDEPAMRIVVDGASPGQIHGHRDDLRQTVVELISNAIEAKPASDTIVVRVEADGGWLRVSVRDDGVGMTEEVADRCVEPFFTTRKGHGRGLGLSVVHGTVRRHGGRVSIESVPGQGTTIVVGLPGLTPVASLDRPASVPIGMRPMRILIVDDNPSMRFIAEAFLKSDGYQDVDVAADGAEALRAFRPGRFDLVLTDYSMPGVGGEQLARTLKKADPNLLIGLMTGYDLEPGCLEANVIDFVLRKPLTRAALRQALGVSNGTRR